MSISISWATTKRIFIPRADMPIVQVSPEIRELNVDQFRLDLKDLEASVEGMPWPDTHRHVTETTLSGFVYARLVEILFPYTVEFEDGQYSVRTAGANHNILDVKVTNQVSLLVQNSAGLINSPDIQFSSFAGGVSVDVTSSFSGTSYPVGTPRAPVNNIADALLIAAARGFDVIFVLSDLTLGPGVVADQMAFVGHTHHVVLTVDGAASVSECGFNNLSLTGTLSGPAHIRDCFILDVDNVHGHITGSSLQGTVTLSGAGDLQIIDCWDGISGTGVPTVDCGAGSNLGIRDYRGGIALVNKTGSDEVSIDGILRLVLDATVTAGDILVRGVGKIEDSGSTATIDQSGLVVAEVIDQIDKKSKLIVASVV